jgi:hypothetical protein
VSEIRNIAAILVAGVVGYSRLAGADPRNATLGAIRRRHQRLSRREFAHHKSGRSSEARRMLGPRSRVTTAKEPGGLQQDAISIVSSPVI